MYWPHIFSVSPFPGILVLPQVKTAGKGLRLPHQVFSASPLRWVHERLVHGPFDGWRGFGEGDGLKVGDHLALMLANSTEYFEVMWGALRSGIYVTPINWHLKVDEIAYILTAVAPGGPLWRCDRSTADGRARGGA